MVPAPDRPKFLADLDKAVGEFIDGKYEKNIVISHNDADGISCLHIIQNLLFKLNSEQDYFIYNRSVSWAEYLKGILSKVQTEKTSKIALIFTDIGSNLEELIPIISNRSEHFFILDHHELDHDINQFKIPENLHFVNPTIRGFDGLDHVAGATLAYMFAKRIKPAVSNQGWLTIIGIAGDTLRSTDKLESLNKEIYQELLDEKLFEDKQGLVIYGNMHESVKEALKFSILPFLKGISGESDQTIKNFLKQFQINPSKKFIDLDQNEIENLQQKLPLNCVGHYAMLPDKQGLLQHAFEHALLLNILCFKNINVAISMIQRKSVSHYAKGIYYEYISDLVKNLKTLINLPRQETTKAIFIEAKNIPPSNWSDTASFCTVNALLDPNKILILGGEEKKNQMIKLSIRCSRDFVENNKGIGVNKIIAKIKEDLGGMGGGHKLAAGLRLSIPSFNRLKTSIDDYI